MSSKSNTVTASITDAAGNVWTITTAGQVEVNGIVDGTTANVSVLAYANGLIWQENTSGLWWSKTSPAASWMPPFGTTAAPALADSIFQPTGLAGIGEPITDAAGNVWTITTGGQVAVNGTVDPTTVNVTHLAYVNGLIWQENTSDLWWSKASPTAAWSPPLGTTTVPVPLTDISVNDTVIGVSTQGQQPTVLTDASGNIWSIVGGQVAVNGVVDRTTANVTELAYVNGLIWQENSQGLWWSKTTPAAAWAPPHGTSTNPVTGAFIVGNNADNNAVISVGELTASPRIGTPQAVSGIITPGVKASGTTILVDSSDNATLVVNGASSLTSGATLELIGAWRPPTPTAFAPLENNGVMTVTAAALDAGVLTGSGSIVASAGSTLAIQSAPGSETIQLRSSHLSIGGDYANPGQPGIPGGMTFLAPVVMDSGGSIALNAIQATGEVLDTLAGSVSAVFLYNGTTEVAALKVAGVAHLYAVNSGSGASIAVTLSTVPSSLDLPIVTHAR